MGNMQLKTKLMVGFGIIVLLLLGVGVFSMLKMNEQEGQSRDIATNLMPSIEYAMLIKADTAEIRNKVYRHILSNDPAEMDKMESDRAKLIEKLTLDIASFGKNNLTPNEKENFDKLKEAMNAYAAVEDQVIKFSKENKNDEAVSLMGGKAFELYNVVSKEVDNLIKFNKDEAEIVVKTSNESYKGTKVLIISVIVISVFIGMIFAFLIVNSITTTIQKILETMRKVSDGDLTAKIEVKVKDELGQVADYFNTVTEKLGGLIGNINTYSISVADGVDGLRANMSQIDSNAAELGTISNTTAAAIEEMAGTVTTISGNADYLLTNARETSEFAEKGGKSVRDTIEEMKKIKSVVGSGSKGVKELGNKTNEIGEIVTVINDIAAQTNLLALNAAIEAARAGEAGKGFEVVAEEVRKLAEKTSQSTKEIARMIKEIQQETSSVIIRMEEIDAEVEEGVKLADDTGDILEKILYKIDELREMITQVANATREQSIATEDIAKQTETVTNSVDETRRAVNESANVAGDIAGIAEQLKELVGSFKLDNRQSKGMKRY